MIKQFDMVKLKTIKNVTYMSNVDSNVSTSGLWSVVGICGVDLVLAKSNVLIKIPHQDVIKAMDYDPITILNKIKENNRGKKERDESEK